MEKTVQGAAVLERPPTAQQPHRWQDPIPFPNPEPVRYPIPGSGAPGPAAKSPGRPRPDQHPRRAEAAPRSGSKVHRFEEEVRRYEQQLVRLATALMGSEADAWDAVQEALIRAYTKMDQFRGEARFTTWLTRILYRTCYDELRRRGRRPLPWGHLNLDSRGEPGCPEGAPLSRAGRCLPPGREEGGMGSGLPGPLLEAIPDPAEQAEVRETQRWVRRAIGQLEPPFRQVVEMRDLQGQSYAEIARTLGLPTGTVKSRLNRARCRLREHLSQYPA